MTASSPPLRADDAVATAVAPAARPSRTVTSRVLSVLDVFTDRRRSLTLSDISRRSGIPLATTHRLVGELVAWGALERDDAGRYQIGLHLWEVGALAPRGLGLREAAMPYLEDLYEATHQHVQLAVLDGLEVVYVERLSARDAVGVHSRVGGRWPAHTTGVGLVLLAFADAALQRRYLTQPLFRFKQIHPAGDPAATSLEHRGLDGGEIQHRSLHRPLHVVDRRGNRGAHEEPQALAVPLQEGLDPDVARDLVRRRPR